MNFAVVMTVLMLASVAAGCNLDDPSILAPCVQDLKRQAEDGTISKTDFCRLLPNAIDCVRKYCEVDDTTVRMIYDKMEEFGYTCSSVAALLGKLSTSVPVVVIGIILVWLRD